MHATHVTSGGGERFFDHVLVSAQWTVSDCGFDDDCRVDGTSDHSVCWADVSPQVMGRHYASRHQEPLVVPGSSMSHGVH